MKRSRTLLIGIVLLALLTMGCSVCSLVQRKGKEVAQTAVATVQTMVAEQATVVVSTATPAPEMPETSATSTAGAMTPGASPSPDVQGGLTYQSLSGLDSYRYELEGQVVEKGVKTTLFMNGAYVREPPAGSLEMESVKGDQPAQITRFVYVEGLAYNYDQEQDGWTVTHFLPAMAGMTDILGLLTAEIEQSLDDGDVELVDAHVRVEGIDCSHYRGDPQDLTTELSDESDITVTGGKVDLWVANELGYLLRMEADVQGVDDEGQPAEQQLNLRMFDVNKPVEVAAPPQDKILTDLTIGSGGETPVPETTPVAPGDGIAQSLPRPEDAESLTGSLPPEAQALGSGDEDLDIYETGLSTSELTAFYKEQMSKEGWTEGDSMPMGEMALLVYTKDDRVANVMILGSGSEGGSMVIVSVE